MAPEIRAVDPNRLKNGSRKPPRVRWTFHGTAVVRRYADALAWLERFCGCRALEFRKLAERRGILVTGGSDFHGAGRGDATIGNPSIPYEFVDKLRERHVR